MIDEGREKEAQMWRLAARFANSGDYTGSWSIEVALLARGHSRAREFFRDERIRERFNRACKEAQALKRRLDWQRNCP